ncbi:hypothetical protein [Dysgonomonas reticulitermitis]
MENIQYEGLLGIMSEVNKKIDVIHANSKSKENQPVHPTVSKTEIEEIVKEKVAVIGNYIELRLKQQTEQQTKILTAAMKEVGTKIDSLPTPEKVSLEPIMKMFPQPKKVTICGFEFLRSSVIIFVLALVCFFSMILNIKQMDDCRGLKTQLYKQTDIFCIWKRQRNKRNSS